MGSKNRVWLPVHKWDVFSLEFGNLRHWQVQVVQVPSSILHGVIEKRAEDRSCYLRVRWKLAKSPWLPFKGRDIDSWIRAKSIFMVSWLILTQLVESLDDIAIFVSVRVTDLVDLPKYSCYLSDLAAEALKLWESVGWESSHTQWHLAVLLNDGIDKPFHIR